MRGTLARAGAVLTAIALAVTGTVSAGASRPTDPRAEVLAVQAMHDRLQRAAAEGDVARVSSTLDRLDPLLAEVDGAQRTESRALAGTAGEAAATARVDLARQFPDGVARVDLPTVPELLNLLLQRLLEILS